MSNKPLEIKVECYAGYKGDEKPVSLVLKTRKIRIAEIIDQWISPEHRYFKVRAEDGGIYIVRNDTKTHTWELIVYDSGTKPDLRLSST